MTDPEVPKGQMQQSHEPKAELNQAKVTHGIKQTRSNTNDAIEGEIGKQSPKKIFEATPKVIEELHRIAKQYMYRENQGHTLQATALVNEAYISLKDVDLTLHDKVHFFAIAASHMRRILVDHARAKNTDKRQAQAAAISADDEVLVNPDDTTSMVLLDEVLQQFSKLDKRAAEMYEMRLFAGLGNEEIATVFEVSITTVEREMKVAKAWVHKRFHDK